MDLASCSQNICYILYFMGVDGKENMYTFQQK